MVGLLKFSLFLIGFVALNFVSAATAATQDLPAIGYSLSVDLPGWTVGILRARDMAALLPPPDQQSRNSLRAIHLTQPTTTARTLDEAIESAINETSARGPKWGSSNDRNHFIGKTPVITAEGLKGLRADFANREPDGLQYTNIRYYFFLPDGRLFEVCSHVWGDQELFDQYNQEILRGLHKTVNRPQP